LIEAAIKKQLKKARVEFDKKLETKTKVLRKELLNVKEGLKTVN